jgi:uncharacterized protein (TIGR03067 family)
MKTTLPPVTGDAWKKAGCGLLALVVSLLATAPLSAVADRTGKKGPTVKPDQQAIQGTWRVVFVAYGGLEAPAAFAARLRVTFRGDRMVLGPNFRISGKTFSWVKEKDNSRWTFKLQPAAKPKRLDLTFTQDAGGAIRGRGFYELKGDTLKICWSVRGKRPTTFTDKSAARYILKRIKS